MSQKIKAVFQNGAFIPQQSFELPEGSEVELTVEPERSAKLPEDPQPTADDPYTIPPEVTDPAERQALLKDLVKRMRENPIPATAPGFTRDELHERR